jgi:hypothetical protein
MRPLMKMLLLGAMLAAVGQPGALQAELILDDFDDPAEAVSPDMLEESIVTANVGDLNASRSFRIAATSGPPTPPIASLDSAVANPSALTAQLIDPGSNLTGANPIFAFQFNYEFSPTDISQAGMNNAIVFDLRTVGGNVGPSFFRVLVTDDTNIGSRYLAEVRNLPLSGGAFMAAMPFWSFTTRGGSPGLPDFTTVKKLEFDFYFLYPPFDAQWTAEIDRIRIGRIPEPNSTVPCLIGVCCVTRRPSRRTFQRRTKDVVPLIGHDARNDRGCNPCTAG